MYGKDFGYASTRILGTIVRLIKDGSPVYVQHVSPEGICMVIPIEKEWMLENAIRVHVDDLDYKPVRLGYVNCGGEATYIQRIPMRRDWKQGLRQENCTTSGRRLFAIPMGDVKNCIINRYPTYAAAWKSVKPKPRGRHKTLAWHRHWAVNTAGEVFYKNYEFVGRVNERGIPELISQYAYLKEALAETM